MIKRSSAKPYIYALLIFTFIALLAAITSVILHGVWDFIGINESGKIGLASSCSVGYVTTKFSAANANRQIFAAFLAVILGCVLTGIIFAIFIMFLCSLFLSKEQKDEEYLPTITPLRVYVLYILIWWTVICFGVNFGYFLTFYL